MSNISQPTLSRRNFLAGAAASLVGLAGATSLAGCAPAAKSTEETDLAATGAEPTLKEPTETREADIVIVGADRVTRRGDAANKIGTSGVAILAKHYGIPVYVLGPTSTIDMACPDGDHIPIEERDGEEIKTMWYEKPMALPEVKCYNPAFDVTDHELIAGIVTEKGICRPPYTKSLKALFDDKK